MIMMTCMMNVCLVTIPGPTEHACLVALSCMPGHLYAVSGLGFNHSVLRGGFCTVCVFAGLLLSAQGSVHIMYCSCAMLSC